MLLSHAVNLIRHLSHFSTCSLNGCPAVALALPALDVAGHLVVASLLLLYIVAELADVGLAFRIIDELEAASLPHAVFLVALLTKVAPAPVATAPERHLKVTHGEASIGRKRSKGKSKRGEVREEEEGDDG